MKRSRKNKADSLFFYAVLLTAAVSVGAVQASTEEPKQPEPTRQIYEVAKTARQVKFMASVNEEPDEAERAASVFELPVEEVAAAEPVILYDVPLEESLRLHIINLCEEKHIDPAVVFAMAFRESSFDASKIGDGGESFGLLQVQPKWHYDRMERLACPDLLDPFQNVTVALDYLEECLNRYDADIAKALTSYNQGFYRGVVNNYANAVLETAEELRGEVE